MPLNAASHGPLVTLCVTTETVEISTEKGCSDPLSLRSTCGLCAAVAARYQSTSWSSATPAASSKR